MDLLWLVYVLNVKASPVNCFLTWNSFHFCKLLAHPLLDDCAYSKEIGGMNMSYTHYPYHPAQAAYTHAYPRNNGEDQRFGFAFIPFLGGLAGGLLGSAFVNGPGYGYKYSNPYPVPYPVPYAYPAPYPYSNYYYPGRPR
jgi:hypothetical protein